MSVLVTIVSPAKAAEPIEVETREEQRSDVLDGWGALIPDGNGHI